MERLKSRNVLARIGTSAAYVMLGFGLTKSVSMAPEGDADTIAPANAPVDKCTGDIDCNPPVPDCMTDAQCNPSIANPDRFTLFCSGASDALEAQLNGGNLTGKCAPKP
jgi:hypothetical protein